MSVICAGGVIPEFTYDTPYSAQSSFYSLLSQDERPVFLIFLRNFGHPITRHYVVRYAQTMAKLCDARLACVVRTRPEVIRENMPEGTLPYTVICDAEGVLYDFLQVPVARSRFTAYSLAGLRILKQAQKQGFHEPKEGHQQLPLTLLVGEEGRVLLAHYGTSVTDQPESCAAMQAVMDARRRQSEKLDRQLNRRRKGRFAQEDGAPEEENELEPWEACAPEPTSRDENFLELLDRECPNEPEAEQTLPQPDAEQEALLKFRAAAAADDED